MRICILTFEIHVYILASQITVALPNAGNSDGHYNLNCFPSLYDSKTESVVVRVTRKWEEFDFMFTHEVTSVDLVIVDAQMMLCSSHLILFRYPFWIATTNILLLFLFYNLKCLGMLLNANYFMNLGLCVACRDTPEFNP
ncbi:hypothetical protein MKX01_001307 [Papaver californicum]|nr:hypothetical protein MKX01_001307 [Papaver californicum]